MTLQLWIEGIQAYANIRIYANYGLVGHANIRPSELIDFINRVSPDELKAEKNKIDPVLWKKLKKFKNLQPI